MKMLNNLEELLLNEAQILYDGKNQMQKVLPGLRAKVHSSEFKKVLQEYEVSNQKQINLIEDVIVNLSGNSEERFKDDVTEQLIKRIENISKNATDSVRDAALISTIQKINHLGIAECGNICAYANALRMNEEARSLHDCLNEEKKIDKQLSDVAKKSVNIKAIDPA